ncbi:MAG TPA: hypothetical protein VG897_00830 [Terriglobales bacterium]|nr:hypothetical protein [Terriglobales bacterium]
MTHMETVIGKRESVKFCGKVFNRDQAKYSNTCVFNAQPGKRNGRS